MLLWRINCLWIRLVPRKQEIPKVRQTKFVVFFFCPLNRGSRLLGDKIFPMRPVWITWQTLEAFDLIVGVVALIGDRVPPFVRTFVDETFRV